MNIKKPLTKEEINTVGWYCKNSEGLRSFLGYAGFRNMFMDNPLHEYITGGDVYGTYLGLHEPPYKRKEVEFVNNNLYWKEDEMETPDPSKTTHNPSVYSEVYWTMGILENADLQEDMREEFLHHLSCLLENVRKNF